MTHNAYARRLDSPTTTHIEGLPTHSGIILFKWNSRVLGPHMAVTAFCFPKNIKSICLKCVVLRPELTIHVHYNEVKFIAMKMYKEEDWLLLSCDISARK